MGRLGSAVMDGLEGGAGRLGSGLLSGFVRRTRAWSIGFWVLAFVVAGFATVTLVGAPEARREAADTMRVLSESGVRADVAVVDDAVDREGPQSGRDDVDLLLELPAAGNARVWIDADLVPGKHDVVVGDRVSVVYAPSDPARYLLPAGDFDAREPVRSVEGGVRTAWWALGLSAIPALAAAVLWRRGRR